MLILTLVGLDGGCVGPVVDKVDVSPQVEQNLATRVPVFMIGQDPPPASLIGPVVATSCNNKVWDPAAVTGRVIEALRRHPDLRGVALV